MWYTFPNTDKLRFANAKKIVTAQTTIKQLDESYFGIYNSGQLIGVLPVNFGANGVNNAGVKLNPQLISQIKISDDSFSFVYPDSNGQPRQYSASLDQQSILPRYLKQQLDEMVPRRDTRSDFERIKNEERLQGQLYREMVQLANQLFAKYQNREQVKKDLQYRIFDLFQSGQISEKLGNYLYKWMTDYVNDEEKLKANVKTSFSLETYLNKLLSDPRFNGTSAQKIPGGYTINFVMPNVPSEGQMFKSTFNVSNGADLINKVNEFIAQSKYTPQQKQDIQKQNNNALPQSNEQIVPEPYKWPKPEIDLTKRK